MDLPNRATGRVLQMARGRMLRAARGPSGPAPSRSGSRSIEARVAPHGLSANRSPAVRPSPVDRRLVPTLVVELAVTARLR